MVCLDSESSSPTTDLERQSFPTKKSFVEKIKSKSLKKKCLSSDECDEKSGTENHVIDLQTVISDNGFYVGKDGFDKNLKTITGVFFCFHIYSFISFKFMHLIYPITMEGESYYPMIITEKISYL